MHVKLILFTNANVNVIVPPIFTSLQKYVSARISVEGLVFVEYQVEYFIVLSVRSSSDEKHRVIVAEIFSPPGTPSPIGNVLLYTHDH